MTAQLEADMTAIADCGQTLDGVTDRSREMLRDVFDTLEDAETEVGSLIAAPTTSENGETGTDNSGPIIGECPDCGNHLVGREVDGSRFIGCQSYPDCDYTLPLPNKGRPHPMDEQCAEHGHQKVKMLAGSHTFVFGCPACQRETAENTDNRIIGDCPECHQSEEGELAIKRVQSGSRLVGCTRFPDCEYSLPLPRNGEIDVQDEMCSEHDLPVVHILKDDGGTWDLGCPICNYQEYKN